MWPFFCLLTLFLALLVAFRPGPRQRRRTALMNAIREGDLQRVKQIVDDGFNLNFNYGYQFMRFGSPLSWAFGRSREIADFLIAHGASVSPKSPGNEALLVS